MPDKSRADYTWQDAAHDLALFTSLTLQQAGHATYALQGSKLHPYDAFPHLRYVFDRDMETRIGALAALIELAQSGQAE